MSGRERESVQTETKALLPFFQLHRPPPKTTTTTTTKNQPNNNNNNNKKHIGHLWWSGRDDVRLLVSVVTCEAGVIVLWQGLGQAVGHHDDDVGLNGLTCRTD